jgi:hypothetical protein
MTDSKATKAMTQKLAKATQAVASRLPGAAVRSSAYGMQIMGRLAAGQGTAGFAKEAGADVAWAHSTPAGVGKRDRVIVSGTIEGFDFVATESGPAESRDVLIEIFADESQSNEHGRQWLAKLSVLDRILTSPDELAVFTGHVLSKLKGKKKAEAAAAILRAVSEGLEG